jgi:hypothetical protein
MKRRTSTEAPVDPKARQALAVALNGRGPRVPRWIRELAEQRYGMGKGKESDAA